MSFSDLENVHGDHSSPNGRESGHKTNNTTGSQKDVGGIDCRVQAIRLVASGPTGGGFQSSAT